MNPGNDACTVSSSPTMEPLEGEKSRFWSNTTVVAQPEKTNQLVRGDVRDSIDQSSLELRDVFLSHSGSQKNFVRQLHRDLTMEDVSCFFDEDENWLPLTHKFPARIFEGAERCKIAVLVLSKEFISSKWPMLELSAFVKAIHSGKNSRLKLLPIFFNISRSELLEITKDSREWKELVESNDTRDEWQAALRNVISNEGLQLGQDGNEVDCRDKAVKEIYRFLKGSNPPRLRDFQRAAQLKKTNQQVRDLMDSLGLSAALQGSKQSTMPVNQYSSRFVFLSYSYGGSGRDKNFVRQLHRDLTRENVPCFFDEDENRLPRAEEFPYFISKAAETCELVVVVLSKEFICSKWSMLELSAFVSAMDSGKNPKLKLLPIFFKSSPKELADMTKDSREWKELVESTRDVWQAALKTVRSINGLTLGDHGNEVQCRDKAVKEICYLLKGINPPKLLDFEPVGIEEQVREVKALLDMEGSQPALAVIVCGFGGTGKSTVAASAIQSIDWSSTDFKFCKAVIDETAPKTSHIIKLQQHIISDLGGGEVLLRDPDDGRVRIKGALNKNCSLLLIDNVVDTNYIRDLLPKELWSGQKDQDQKAKLRILMTSRDKNVKKELSIMCKEYDVKVLSDEASKRLLLDTILQSKVVDDIEFDEKCMINEVAVACKGVPLLVSVFGNHLRVEREEEGYQKDKGCYRKENYDEALRVLKEGRLDSFLNFDLGSKLMFVYDKIRDVEIKEAFLDICSYFHGWEWNLVADIVDSSKLGDLRRRMLVSKGGSGEVIVHDILQSLGTKKAERTRFSNYKELLDASEENSDNLDFFRSVKGISLLSDDGLMTIPSTQLEAMHKSLRVLMLGDWVALDGPCQKAFPNLRYLRVGDVTAFPFKDPSKLEKLRVLLNRSMAGMNLSHLPSSLKHISHEVPDVECDKFVKLPFQNLSSLKSFNVKTQKSVELPEELHLPASLVDLDLNGCKNLPKDIGHLTALESLILNGSDLECLPQGFGKLKKLKRLSMDYCSKLTFLSDELGMLSSLEVISMKESITNLGALPQSFGGLLSLQTLELEGSINLQRLPESFGELRIHSLKLHSLKKLQDLPNSFGNMPLLKDLSLKSCHSLMSLPNSFVQLEKLETLKISECPKLSVLPKDFGRLRCLKVMTVEECDLLKELPHGFGALPALKTFILIKCNSFVDFPRDFTELTCLEELILWSLPLISSFPDGFGKLKKLRVLFVWSCYQLKTLSDDLEEMATLERLEIRDCPEVDGAMMKKILKLQNCYLAAISGSTKLKEKWQHMQGESEHPIVVDEYEDIWIKERPRATRVALSHGTCMEVKDASDELTERSSLLGGLEDHMTATVALIMLPVQGFQSHPHSTLQRLVERARERAESNGSGGKLQIVCARKLNLWDAERATAREEKEREEEVHRILVSLPKGSCGIPSPQTKRRQILSWCCGRTHRDKLSFVTADVGVNMEGRRSFENFIFSEETDISENVGMEPPRPSEVKQVERKQYNSIQKFIESICAEDVRGASKTRELVEALKGNGIDHLLIHNNTTRSKVKVDDLHGKSVSFIICDVNFFKWINLQQIYKDLQQKDSNFIAIWIPTEWPEDWGHGTYTRLIESNMPLATFPRPQLVNVNNRKAPCFVVLDRDGQIANHDALPLLLAWGEKAYPFTPNTIPQSFTSMESESCLDFLLEGMNIVRPKLMKSKMIFLYVQHPNKATDTVFEELFKIHGIFDVLYVGKFSDMDIYDTENLKKVHEDAIENMHLPSLSFSDMIMFWYRCKYLASDEGCESNKESNIMMKSLHGLAKQLIADNPLVLVDTGGLVTRDGYDVLKMIYEPSYERPMVKEEVMKSLSIGECSPLFKTIFRDEIDNDPQHLKSLSSSVVEDEEYNHPQHSQHRISLFSATEYEMCDVCNRLIRLERGRSYKCHECEWMTCGRCRMACIYHLIDYLE